MCLRLRLIPYSGLTPRRLSKPFWVYGLKAHSNVPLGSGRELRKLNTMQNKDLKVISRLLRQQRWASLATLKDGHPESSQVAFAMEPGYTGILLHLSQLAAHTKNLLNDPRVSLGITEQDTGENDLDPQTLARLSVHGLCVPVESDSDQYVEAKAVYLQRLPSAAPLFGFSDFQLFRLTPLRGRMIGGFGSARDFGADVVRMAADLNEP